LLRVQKQSFFDANFSFSLYTNVTHNIISTNNIKEKNSDAALEVKGQTSNVSQVTLGSRGLFMK